MAVSMQVCFILASIPELFAVKKNLFNNEASHQFGTSGFQTAWSREHQHRGHESNGAWQASTWVTIGAGACRDDEGRYLPWGESSETDSTAQAKCEQQSSCMAYSAPPPGESASYAQFYCSTQEGLCTGSGSGAVTVTTSEVHGHGFFCHRKGSTEPSTTNPSATAYGDPHLSNIHGKKFDVHDGLHRLVHFPRGASESEALLKIDADATMMPGETSCYNVFFQSARISGKWVGDDVLLKHDDAPMGKKRFLLGTNGTFHDWSELAKDAAILKFSGTEPVKVSAQTREELAETPGGDDVEFSIGREHPVLVQVWASKGNNELTDHKDVQYLNLEVSNLPANTGGLLGLDAYSRPAGSKCGLTSKEEGAINSLDDLVGLAAKRTKSLHWRISAHAHK